MSIKIIENFKVVFWDFDGVIKDSIEVKSDAFEKIFLSFGENMTRKIRVHHEANGGISRFDKLPIYLKLVGETPSNKIIREYADRFSISVKQKVIESKWVNGVLDHLKDNHNKKQFFLVTATPQKEIEEILCQLKIENYFKKVVGSPTAKKDAIKALLKQYSISPEKAIMIGDSISDYDAAKANNMAFLLRKTRFNKELQEGLNCQMINDFHDG
jgi:phosphoglycolate phosphatase-like HAD superfamily hydrolase